MVKMLAVNTSYLGCEMPSSVEAVRAEALFMSTLQSSESPAPDQVRRAVATTMQRLGIGGCASQMAREFGDHPDTAGARMTWALATIRTASPRRRRRSRRITGYRWLSRADRGVREPIPAARG